MFCPKCGNADQMPDTFCRRCGMFLHDFDKLERKVTPPEVHLEVNRVLSAMTAVVSLTLAILLHLFFVVGKDSGHPLIYVTAGFLAAMFFWQAQSFWRNLQLKKQLLKTRKNQNSKTVVVDTNPLDDSARSKKLLNESDLSNAVPPSIVENTTKRLGEKVPRKSS